MNRREELSKKLHDIIGNDNVFFQPPASDRIKYPCCIYELGRGATTRANNSIYNYVNSYQLMFIYPKHNEGIIKDVLNSLTLCSFEREYIADGLYHYVFNVYY